MVTYIIAGLFFVLATASSYSQNTEWIRYFGGDTQQSTTTGDLILRTSDSSIVVIGNEKVGTGAGRMSIVITKLTFSGDTLWTRRLYGRYGAMAAGVYEMDNGNYVIGGREREENYTFPENYWQPMLAAIKPNGDSVWKRTYPAPRYNPNLDHKNIGNRFVSLLATDNGHTLMLNRINGVHYVLKVDAIGRSVSGKVLYMESHTLRHMRRRENRVIEIPYTRGVEVGIMRLNDSADTLGSTALLREIAPGSSSLIDVLPTPEDGYLIGAYTSWNIRGTDKNSVYLARTDSGGAMIADTLWNMNRFFDEPLVLNSIRQMKNGGYVMATSDTGAIWVTNADITGFTKVSTIEKWIPTVAVDNMDGSVLVTGSQVVNGVQRGFIAKIKLPVSSVRGSDYLLPSRMDLW